MIWFGAGFTSYHRTALQLFFPARGCPHGTKLRTAHYFSIRNLRLSKNLPPFGRRRVAVRSIAPKAANVDLRLTPYKFQVPSRNLQGVLSVAG